MESVGACQLVHLVLLGAKACENEQAEHHSSFESGFLPGSAWGNKQRIGKAGNQHIDGNGIPKNVFVDCGNLLLGTCENWPTLTETLREHPVSTNHRRRCCSGYVHSTGLIMDHVQQSKKAVGEHPNKGP